MVWLCFASASSFHSFLCPFDLVKVMLKHISGFCNSKIHHSLFLPCCYFLPFFITDFWFSVWNVCKQLLLVDSVEVQSLCCQHLVHTGLQLDRLLPFLSFLFFLVVLFLFQIFDHYPCLHQPIALLFFRISFRISRNTLMRINPHKCCILSSLIA